MRLNATLICRDLLVRTDETKQAVTLKMCANYQLLAISLICNDWHGSVFIVHHQIVGILLHELNEFYNRFS
jgi:hypothetical protein